MATLSCHSNQGSYLIGTKTTTKKKQQKNNNNNNNYLPPPPPSTLMASEEMILEYFSKISVWLPWQPVKFSGLNTIHMFCRGLLKEHFCKTFIKIYAMR